MAGRGARDAPAIAPVFRRTRSPSEEALEPVLDAFLQLVFGLPLDRVSGGRLEIDAKPRRVERAAYFHGHREPAQVGGLPAALTRRGRDHGDLGEVVDHTCSDVD